MDRLLLPLVVGLVFGTGIGFALARFLTATPQEGAPITAGSPPAAETDSSRSAPEAEDWESARREAAPPTPAEPSDAEIDGLVRRFASEATEQRGSGVLRAVVQTADRQPVPDAVIRIERLRDPSPRSSSRRDRPPAPSSLEKAVESAVRSYRDRQSRERRAATDGGGRVAFNNLADGMYTASAWAKGFEIVPREGNRAAWSPGETIEFTAAPLVALPVEVRLPGGKLAEHTDLNCTSVEAGTRSSSTRGWSRESPEVLLKPGHWEIQALAGPHRVGRYETVWSLRSKQVTVMLSTDREPEPLILECRVRGVIAGSVRSEDGSRSDRITVYLRPAAEVGDELKRLRDGRSDHLWREDNTFQFQDLEPGTWSVGAQRGYGDELPILAHQTVEVGVEPAHVTLLLPPPDPRRHLKVRCLGPDGKPVADVHLGLRTEIRSGMDSHSSSGGVEAIARPDDLWWIPIPEEYIDALKSGKSNSRLFATAHSDLYGEKEMEVFPGPKVYTLQFAPAASLEVTVLGYGSSPLAGDLELALRSAEGDENRSHGGQGIDSSGVLRFQNVQVGDYEVVLSVASGPRFRRTLEVASTPVSLKPGTQSIAIGIPALYSLTVRAPDQVGQSLEIRREGSDRWETLRAEVGESGEAVFEYLSAGTWIITSSMGLSEMRIEVPAASTVDFQPVEFNALVVSIRDANGALATQGLQEGDVIVQIGEQRLDAPGGLQAAMFAAMQKGKLPVVLLRGNQEITQEIDFRVMQGNPGGELEPTVR